MPEVRYKLTERQQEAWKHLNADENTELLYGGAKGGGKSFFLCLWALHWTNHLIDYFQLSDINNPVPLGFLGRKQSVDFTHTTLETWKRIIPADMYLIREQEKEIIVRGAAKLWYGGLDRSESINKFNSAELAFFCIDQSEETDRKDVAVLEAALRFKFKGIKPPYKKLYTANPAECWLKESFIYKKKRKKEKEDEDVKKKKKYRNIYIPALPTDNPNLPEDYEETLKSAFSHNEDLLKAYLEGDWEAMSVNRSIIPMNALEGMRNKQIFGEDSVKRLISCDPSTGGDECVVYVFENTKIIDQRILNYDDEMKIAGEIMLLASTYDVKYVVIDGIGVGSALASRLAEIGKPAQIRVNKIISSNSAHRSELFLNRRAEMWWHCRMQYINKVCLYPDDEKLRNQLTSVQYRVIDSSGKIKAQSKSELSESPDRADCFVYGIWGLQFIGDDEDDTSTQYQRENIHRVNFKTFSPSSKRRRAYA